ncbi:hypothetical protein [Rhizohabitans arisaemae]|uniref:hypothetical protein n=1 Tax=Rhizohabitans arisaemae TaxID=2720610 RepID=UPI0024B24C46|nr:hypothetical protein [Rhizohabitans arisaemae]
MTNRPGEPSPALSNLVREACLGGVSYRQLAESSVDEETGTRLDFRWINALAHDRLANAPTPARLRALAKGLSMPVEELKRLAAIQWLDYHVTVDIAEAGEWVLWTQLNEEDLAAVRILVEGLASRRKLSQNSRENS